MRNFLYILFATAAAMFLIYRILRRLKTTKPRLPKREFSDGDFLDWSYQKEKDKDEQLK